MSILNTALSLAGKIPSPLTTGLSVGAQIFGAIKGGQANKATQALQNKNVEANEAYYNNNAQKSFLDTNVAKDQVKEINQQAQTARKAIAGRSAIAGASDEANLAANTNATNATNNAMSDLAGKATQFQNQQRREYMYEKDRLDANQQNINNARAENSANLVANAGDLFRTVTFGAKGKVAPTPTDQWGRTAQQNTALNDIKNSAN